MTQTGPPSTTPTTTPPARGAARAARLRPGRPVHVDHVEVEPRADGRRVRAVVRLGARTPADVRVELLPTREALRGDADDRRMWSTLAYGNGCFVFETTIRGADCAAGEWLVRVRSVRDPYAPLVAHRVRIGDGP